MSSSIGETVKEWVGALDGELLERDAAVRLSVVALLSGHHLLLLGEPGTAKTLLAQRAASMLGATPFVTLLTKFSTPEDVFGPLSLKGLEEGRYERLTNGYLPAAEVSFVDEIFKANASILNAMLSILNERTFFNGSRPQEVPLVSLFAASNELPDDDEGLDALDDRLILRVSVNPLREATNAAELFRRRTPPMLPRVRFSIGDVRETRKAARRVALPEDLLQVMLSLRDDCRAQELKISDRRWRQALDVMATCAVVDGDTEIQPAHLGVLRFVMWRRPSDQTKVVDLLASALKKMKLTTVTASANEILELINERRNELIAVASEVRDADRGYYSRPADPMAKVRPRAIEALTKTQVVLSSAKKYQQEVIKVLAGGLQLWRPFWEDVVARLPIAQEIAKLEAHEVLSEAFKARLQAP